MRVTFLHPDLGIGGAERLIVDAAVALEKKGHTVKLVTAQYDRGHCFRETLDMDVDVIKLFPRDIFGRFYALCAYIRMILAAFVLCYRNDFDVIVCDQVSACLPVFRWFSRARRVFYCHYPDMLLTKRETLLKSLYRKVIDSFEEWTTGQADRICVNSQYTAGIFPKAEHVFLSLNRYERKKNVALAIRAYAKLQYELSPAMFEQTALIIAGGYDQQNVENPAHYVELVELAAELKIPTGKVVFLKSPNDAEKLYLLKQCAAVVYTPENEHFGIVPVEAMFFGKPVIACNSGGPKESIDDTKTGFLLEQSPADFASAMKTVALDRRIREIAAKEGPERVKKHFSFAAFATRFDRFIRGEKL
ncbi:unnamed protein product, partial [Mesorhabditis spiculigera]